MANNNIVVTGFGPFSGHPINASWESVKLLPKEIDGFNIITEQIPVVYADVDTRVPYLWKTHNPQVYSNKMRSIIYNLVLISAGHTRWRINTSKRDNIRNLRL